MAQTFHQHVDRSHYKSGMSLGDKPAFGTGIINMMTSNNATFPTPTQPLPAYKATCDALAIAQGNYMATGSHQDKNARNIALALFYQQTDILAAYVDGIAAGSQSIINLAGFTATSATPTATAEPVAQGKASVALPAKGELRLSVKKVGKVGAYGFVAATSGMAVEVNGALIKVTATNGEHVYIQVETHEETTMQGLAGGEELDVVILPVNLAGAGPATTGLSATVQ